MLTNFLYSSFSKVGGSKLQWGYLLFALYYAEHMISTFIITATQWLEILPDLSFCSRL
jgi:hypothetical protein